MKTSVLFKIFVILPLLFFVDYVIMVLLGCSTCLLGFRDGFYCGAYCLFGKIILLLSVTFFLFIIFPDIKELFKKTKNVSPSKE
jgi:hypothetical protein